MVTIEPATTDDSSRIADLWVDLARDQRRHGSHIPAETNRTTIQHEISRHLMTSGILVARNTDEIIGFVMFNVQSDTYDQDTTRGTITNLYVHPDHRNDTIGTQLLTAAEQTLANTGVQTIAIEAMAENTAAQRLYHRHGYNPHRIELEKHIETDNDTNPER